MKCAFFKHICTPKIRIAFVVVVIFSTLYVVRNKVSLSRLELKELPHVARKSQNDAVTSSRNIAIKVLESENVHVSDSTVTSSVNIIFKVKRVHDVMQNL